MISINERGTSFFGCLHKHMELHLTDLVSCTAGMRLFRFLADFGYFQGKFHHFCESSIYIWIKIFFLGGGGGPETVFRCQLDNSGGVNDVC